MSGVPSPTDRLATPGAFLSRTDLRELGLERGYSRPLIRVEDYRALIEASTYRGDRVRPS